MIYRSNISTLKNIFNKKMLIWTPKKRIVIPPMVSWIDISLLWWCKVCNDLKYSFFCFFFVLTKEFKYKIADSKFRALVLAFYYALKNKHRNNHRFFESFPSGSHLKRVLITIDFVCLSYEFLYLVLTILDTSNNGQKVNEKHSWKNQCSFTQWVNSRSLLIE